MKAKAAEWREKMIDMIVEQDDDVLAAYFEVRGGGRGGGREVRSDIKDAGARAGK